MSTIKASNIQNGSSSSVNIELNTDGSATCAQIPVGPSSFLRNKIINGAMEIDQRNNGSSVTPTADSSYTLDGWAIRNFSGSGRFSVQRQTSITPANFSYAVGLTVTTADSSNSSTYSFEQRIEGYNLAGLGFGFTNSNYITISFWVRSSITGTYCLAIRDRNATYSYISEYSINVANEWENKKITIPTLAAGEWNVANFIGMFVDFALGSNSARETTAGAWQTGNFIGTSNQVEWIANSGATFYLTGVQIEAGFVQTPFERRLYPQELAICQRYCVVYGGDDLYERIALGQAIGSGTAQLLIFLPQEMRAVPSFTTSGNFILLNAGGSGQAVTGFSIDRASRKILQFVATCASGLVAGYATQVTANNSLASRFIVSAEL